MNIYNQTAWKEHNIWFDTDCIIPGRPVDVARNMLTQRFLKSHCDYMWFVDDDNPPALDVLEHLLSHEKDIVSALVPIRHGSNYLLNIFRNKEHVITYE